MKALRRVLTVLFLSCLLSGCAGILTAKNDEPVVPTLVALPQGWAYGFCAEFVATPANDASTTSALGTTSGVSQDVGDAAFGFAAVLSKMPLIGWMFAARVGERAMKNMGGKGDSGPVTPAVMVTAIQSGRVLRILYWPVRTDAVGITIPTFPPAPMIVPERAPNVVPATTPVRPPPDTLE